MDWWRWQISGLFFLSLIRSLGITVLAARAYGLQAIDGITLDTGDEATYRMNCVQARDMGFDGKTLYKGGQGIDIVHEVRDAPLATSQGSNLVGMMRFERRNGTCVCLPCAIETSYASGEKAHICWPFQVFS
jgi:hypothetical protein